MAPKLKWVSLGLFHPEISGVIWAPTKIPGGPTGAVLPAVSMMISFRFSGWTNRSEES